MSKREPTPGWTRCGLTHEGSRTSIDGIYIWDHEPTLLLDQPVFVTDPMNTSGRILRVGRYQITAQGKTVVFGMSEISPGGYLICVPDAAVDTVKGPRW